MTAYAYRKVEKHSLVSHDRMNGQTTIGRSQYKTQSLCNVALSSGLDIAPVLTIVSNLFFLLIFKSNIQ